MALLQAADVRTGRALDPDRCAIARARPRDRRRGFGGPRPGSGTPQPGRAARRLPTSRRSPTRRSTIAKALRTIFIQFPAANWEAELESNYRRDVDVPATVTIDGTVYRDVGVRFRGNSSYRMVPSGFKRSLNLSLDAMHPDQHVGGYNTLNLLNANGDPTFVRTVLYSEIARSTCPLPKVNFVRVVINGESWGIYVNVQQFNKDFLRDFFGTTKGVALEGAGQPARPRRPRVPRRRRRVRISGLYEIKSKDDRTRPGRISSGSAGC